MQDNVCGSGFFAHNTAPLRSPRDRSKRVVTVLLLPEGALPSHRVLPVRNDVGAAVRHDVVVVLSIGGKDLGGTGHLRLGNVEQKACSLPAGENKRAMRVFGWESAAPPGLLPSICLFFTNLWPNDVAAPCTT